MVISSVFTAMRPQSARGRVQPVPEKPLSHSQQKKWSLQQETQSLSNRIEGTQILQKLMKDNEVNSQPTSVKSRIKTFEKCSSHPNLLEEPDVSQLRPLSNHPKQRSWDHTYASSDGK